MKPIRSGREPFEIALLSAVMLYGLTATIFFEQVSVTTLKSFPAPWGQLFIAVYGLGAGIALWGAIQASITGILVEKVGLWLVAGLGSAFAIWSFGVNGIRALAFVILVIGVAAASAARLRQIHVSNRLSTTQAGIVTDERTE